MLWKKLSVLVVALMAIAVNANAGSASRVYELGVDKFTLIKKTESLGSAMQQLDLKTALRLKKDSGAKDERPYAAGAGSRFLIIGEDDLNYFIIFNRVNEIDMRFIEGLDQTLGLSGIDKVEEKIRLRMANSSEIFMVRKDDLPDYQYGLIGGHTGGWMVVPYKHRYTSGETMGDPMIGGYWGYKSQWLGYQSTFVAGFGVSLVTKEEKNDTRYDLREAATIATGIFFDFSDSVHAGVLLGIDHLGGNGGNSWRYEDMPWASLAIGFKFIQ
jgi:hypothetical protein